jgi:hypothetical protein
VPRCANRGNIRRNDRTNVQGPPGSWSVARICGSLELLPGAKRAVQQGRRSPPRRSPSPRVLESDAPGRLPGPRTKPVDAGDPSGPFLGMITLVTAIASLVGRLGDADHHRTGAQPLSSGELHRLQFSTRPDSIFGNPWQKLRAPRRALAITVDAAMAPTEIWRQVQRERCTDDGTARAGQRQECVLLEIFANAVDDANASVYLNSQHSCS